jgi:hypothetical protein
VSTNVNRSRAKRLLEIMLRQEAPAVDSFSIWTTQKGSLALSLVGALVLTEAARTYQKVDAWKSYPVRFLERLIAVATIEHRPDVDAVLAEMERRLGKDSGRHRAFVPFWGFNLDDDVVLNVGPYEVKVLGEKGFEDEVLRPFRDFRSVGGRDIGDELERVKKDFRHVSARPGLVIEYEGVADSATEAAAPVGERVSEFLQFIVGVLTPDRGDVRIVDHRGAYVGRFSTFMPVLSMVGGAAAPNALRSPNLLKNPAGPTIDEDAAAWLMRSPLAQLLPHALDEPAPKSKATTTFLLRAVRLFADAERAVSERQAIVSYVGACDALFNHKEQPTLYVTAGMAATSNSTFEDALEVADRLYEERSGSVHLGIEPTSVPVARRFALNAIWYVVAHIDVLQNKTAIRKWIEPHVERVLRLRKERKKPKV